MTSEERLAIAEELANGWVPLQFVIDSFTVEYHEGNWQAYRGNHMGEVTPLWKRHSPLTPSCMDKFECIHIARKILKDEREAKKSEREKRLEDFALFVRDWMAGFGSYVVLKQRLDKALKESA